MSVGFTEPGARTRADAETMEVARRVVNIVNISRGANNNKYKSQPDVYASANKPTRPAPAVGQSNVIKYVPAPPNIPAPVPSIRPTYSTPSAKQPKQHFARGSIKTNRPPPPPSQPAPLNQPTIRPNGPSMPTGLRLPPVSGTGP